jgi:phosphoribosylaminoimidazolecarboxamide formyltransferase/IMP cyclohydrolase
MNKRELKLRYGMNPHQVPARVFVQTGELPITVLNGQPGYINLLDALNAWQLVKELKQVLNLPAAASFKHVSPAGAAVAIPMSPVLQSAHMTDGMELSPLATAYARARGADRMSSFGDWAALSDPVDLATAQLLRREVSDGVIAPDYHPEALALLKAKKDGAYRIIGIDPDYEPPALETRQVLGITFEQKRNDVRIASYDLQNIVTQEKGLTEQIRIDLTVAQIALKYIQSNSICLAYGGQLIGVGAGQQSRIHCTRLASAKADTWYLRQHPAVLELPFKQGIGRPAKDNAIDQYLLDSLPAEQEEAWRALFTEVPQRLSRHEKTAWLAKMEGVTLGSDAFIPFRDNIDRAVQSGVKYVVQPGGSLRDEGVIEACNQYGMVMVFTGTRLFHH